MTSSDLWTDGNTLAGPLHDLIGPDVTAAIGRCGNCGRAWLDLRGLTYLQLAVPDET